MMRKRFIPLFAGAILLMGVPGGARAQDDAKSQTTLYGFVMTDAGYFTTPVNPDWFDTMRPSKLPSFEHEFGAGGNTYFSVRQSKIGVKQSIPLSMGELKTQFEFDMFGVGPDAGQTTIRPRIYYGELGKFGAGQIMSAFMDLDVFPNCLDYWGPNGMLFFRNPQVRWMPVMTDKGKLTIALERPGASGDLGVLSDRVELGPAADGLNPRFPVPDLSGNYRAITKWGYVQVGGIVRRIEWEDLTNDAFELGGNVTAWGATASTNIKMKNSVLRLQFVHGEGVENYFNDAPVDVAPELQPGNLVTPFKGKALPITGVTAFIDHNWNQKWSSTLGYSQDVIENSDGQAPDAFHLGEYALGNLLYSPDPKLMMGFEAGWEKRENNTDGFDVTSWRLNASFKYSFSKVWGGE